MRRRVLPALRCHQVDVDVADLVDTVLAESARLRSLLHLDHGPLGREAVVKWLEIHIIIDVFLGGMLALSLSFFRAISLVFGLTCTCLVVV